MSVPRKNQIFWISVSVFLTLWLQGSLLGMSDDEAYYWVLAQHPALGYAFHPPAVAWSLAFFQSLFGWILGTHSSAMARLPAAAYSAGIVALGLVWISDQRRDFMPDLRRGAWTLLSFAGLFGASWMMVPDLPLLFSWTLLFILIWKLCAGLDRRWIYPCLSFATAWSLLSKYSAILAVFSAVISLAFWADRRVFRKSLAAVTVGVVIALVPIVLWNASHSWASILYQVRDRHEGMHLSWLRYLKFWLIELVLVGPPLLFYALRHRRSDKSGLSVARFCLVWALPGAAIFLLQPLWADFKPHWAFVVWLPFALQLSLSYSQGRDQKWAKAQIGYGWTLIILAWGFCYFPLLGVFVTDPKLDVTSDLYGWSELRSAISKIPGGQDLPVVGSRYQTASQAAFALGDVGRVTLIPRDLKQMEEWPDLHVSESQGPSWPKLWKPVLYVSDNRYTQAPEFSGADCAVVERIEKRRWGRIAKVIEVWRCDPAQAPKP